MGWETVVVFMAIVALMALFLAVMVAAMVWHSGWVSERARRRGLSTKDTKGH